MSVVHIDSQCVVDNEGRARNLASALARGHPPCELQPERPERLAIVAAGPSVPDFLDEIATFDHVWSVNGAYGYLIDQGIICDGFIGVDPLPTLSGYFGKAHKHTTYYLSAECDPSVFDVLQGYNIRLWMPEQDGVDIKVTIPKIAGGTTAVTRTPFVARFLGYRDITLFGVDSSFRRSRYCYAEGEYPDDS